MSLAPGIYKALRLFGPRDEGRPVPTAPQESTAAAVAGLAESIRRLDLAAAPAEIVNLVSTPVMIENLVSGMEMCDQPAPAGESDAVANAKAPASGENQGANQGAPVGVAVSSRTRSSESERSPARPAAAVAASQSSGAENGVSDLPTRVPQGLFARSNQPRRSAAPGCAATIPDEEGTSRWWADARPGCVAVALAEVWPRPVGGGPKLHGYWTDEWLTARPLTAARSRLLLAVVLTHIAVHARRAGCAACAMTDLQQFFNLPAVKLQKAVAVQLVPAQGWEANHANVEPLRIEVGGELLLGRGKKGLTDPHISREHCKIVATSTGVVLTHVSVGRLLPRGGGNKLPWWPSISCLRVLIALTAFARLPSSISL